jgi:hypothetical protein
LFTASAGVLRTNETYTNPSLGIQNDVLLAGIQGIPTEGREGLIGPPNLTFANGYTGVSFPGGFGVPGSLWGDTRNGKASVNVIRSTHTLAAGFEYADFHNFGAHGSDAARGAFNFTNLYANDGFADYLLGLPGSSARNDPLGKGGVDGAPYLAGYVQDSWRVNTSLTLDLGLRYEHWGARHNFRNMSSTWDPELQKMVVAVDSTGAPNLTEYTVTRHLAEATRDLWVTARDGGHPGTVSRGVGGWGPRLGVVYRPLAQRNIVFRAGYGTYYNRFTGNRGSSTRNIPFWTRETLTLGLTTLQPWETMWPATPIDFQPFTVYAPADDVEPARTHTWNVSLQTSLPFQSALTLSYVGTRVVNEFSMVNYNSAPIGPNPNLQAARPHLRFANIYRYENLGRNWYNGLQAKVERRFAAGISYTFAYAFSRTMSDGIPDCEVCELIPFSPGWYNRGRTGFDIRHIQNATLVWDMPFGRGKQYFSGMGRVLDAFLGGWQLAMQEQARSGLPLSISTGVANLGNGYGTRANVAGDLRLDDPTPAQAFNTSAFSQPAPYQFGNAGMGIIDGPGFFAVDTTLSKKFFVGEQRYFQLRWEAFNLFNRVNYSNPNTTLNSTTFGRITSAESARFMQLGVKFLF